MKSGRSGALKSCRLGLSYEASECSDARTGDLDVLTTHEKSLMKMTNPGECRHKYKTQSSNIAVNSHIRSQTVTVLTVHILTNGTKK